MKWLMKGNMKKMTEEFANEMPLPPSAPSKQMFGIEFDHTKVVTIERDSSISLYTWDEVNKLIEAFQEKYNLSRCDELPYHPKPLKVKLTGTVI